MNSIWTQSQRQRWCPVHHNPLVPGIRGGGGDDANRRLELRNVDVCKLMPNYVTLCKLMQAGGGGGGGKQEEAELYTTTSEVGGFRLLSGT